MTRPSPSPRRTSQDARPLQAARPRRSPPGTRGTQGRQLPRDVGRRQASRPQATSATGHRPSGRPRSTPSAPRSRPQPSPRRSSSRARPAAPPAPASTSASAAMWDRIAAVRVRRQLAHQHRQRLLRRPAVRPGHVARQRRRRLRPARRPGLAASSRSPSPTGSTPRPASARGAARRGLTRSDVATGAAPDPSRVGGRTAASPSRPEAARHGRRGAAGPAVRDRCPARGRRRSASSPAGSGCARPSSGARTSSSTPTPCAGSSGWPGSGRDDVVVEVGPGLGLADPGAAAGGAARDGRRGGPDPRGRAAGDRRGAAAGACRPARRSSHADALHGDRRCPDPQPTALVANLPYNISVPVVLTFLEALPHAAAGAGHGAARGRRAARGRPGQRTYGVPSLKAAWYADVRLAGTVGRSVFWPVPNVDSGLVSLVRREPPQTTATREEVFACIDAAFAQRRKTLRAALAGWAGGADRRRGGAARGRHRPAHPRRAAGHRAPSPRARRGAADGDAPRHRVAHDRPPPHRVAR